MILAGAPLVGVFIGGVSFGFAGFAFALFANSALALAAPLPSVIPAVMLVADTLALGLLVEHRAHIRRDQLRMVPPFAPWSASFLLAGLGLGSVLLGRVPLATGRLALAGVVLAFVTLQAVGQRTAERREAPNRDVAARTAAAFGAGVLDGWLGTGGVIIALYLTWKRLAPGRFIAAMLAYFFAADALRVVKYAVLGYWTGATFGLYVQALPVALLGYAGGLVLRRRFTSPAVFRAAVLGILAVYGLALIRSAVGHP